MEQKIDPYPASFTGSHQRTPWQLIKSYWRSNQRLPAYLFFSILAVMTVSLVGLDVIFNYSYYYFYDVLQSYNKHGAIRLLLVFLMLSAFYALFEGYRFLLSQLLGQRFRGWITAKLMRCVLQRPANIMSLGFDRRQKEVGALINYSLELSMGLIGVITTFLLMAYVLWLMSGNLTLGALKLPGLLVWVGLIYAVTEICFIFKTGRPMFSLTTGKDRGMAHQFAPTQKETVDINKPLKFLLQCSTACYLLYVILPLLIAVPSYFDHVFMLSWLIQSLRAFNRMQGTLSCIVKAHATCGNKALA